MRQFFSTALLLMFATGARAQTWKPLGPPGGDVHSLAMDPSHPGKFFLGTADGHIFGSQDDGEHWALLGRAGARQDAVITAIVVDPRDSKVLFASTRMQDPAAGGGIFRSADGGQTWRTSGLEGQAVRALAIAPSDADILVAGTLDGVYRSHDDGKSWERISPEHHEELRNLDSLAVDPRDPQTVYAGTFHLPWKTTDGGRTWRPVHDGMIDDSDVMSLFIDNAMPGRVYAGACSGIYRGDADQWQKIQGIPYGARRTYVITQDPQHPDSVFAATSEGLWKTSDAGKTWHRTTPQDWVVNTVVVSSGRAGRVVIGTEQFGVLLSDDGGEHFQDANSGFFHRQILALALDPSNPGRVLAVLANASEPIVATGDGGKTWMPLGPGLRTEQILRVYAGPDGWWASLAQGGLMRYNAQKNFWQRAGAMTGETAAKASLQRGPRSRKTKSSPLQFEPIVNDIAFSSARWFAATENGLWESADQGATWSRKPIGPLATLPVRSVRVSSNGERIWVVSLRSLVFSSDAGKSWSWHDLPLAAGGALSLDLDRADERMMVSTAVNGLYISRDAGKNWRQAGGGLPAVPVQSFTISGNIFVASMRTGGLYVSADSGHTWTRLAGTLADGLFPALTTQAGTGVIFAASATEGLYAVQMPASAVAAEKIPDLNPK
ncbi:MAG: glycosyl hydrolase, repeat protein [Candidatus Acidoferrum typicum]|nr:glycosyl hydrolase, repeat protein [Candidatus Acidoferrum typicum]